MKQKSEREKLYKKAIRTAQEELSREDSIRVVNTIAANINDFEKEPDRKKRKRKKKR